MKAHHRDRFVLKVCRQIAQRRFGMLPIVQCRLERRRDVRGIGVPGEIVGHDDQPSIAAGFERS